MNALKDQIKNLLKNIKTNEEKINILQEIINDLNNQPQLHKTITNYTTNSVISEPVKPAREQVPHFTKDFKSNFETK